MACLSPPLHPLGVGREWPSAGVRRADTPVEERLLVRETLCGGSARAMAAGTFKVGSLGPPLAESESTAVILIALRGAVAAGMGALLGFGHNDLLTV